MTAAQVKDNRIAVRLSGIEKELLERAASQMNMSLTDFVVSTCIDKASELFEDPSVFYISDEDYDWLLDLISKPFVPSENFKQLMTFKSKVKYDQNSE